MANRLNRVAKLETKESKSSKVHGIAFNGILDHIPSPYEDYIGKPIGFLTNDYQNTDFCIVDMVEDSL